MRMDTPEKDVEKGLDSPISAVSSHDGQPITAVPSLPEAASELPIHDSVDLSLRGVEPVDIRVENLTLNVDMRPNALENLSNKLKKRKTCLPATQTKTILNNVTAYMPSGSLTAIIGASGSGKTSMLNIMANRISSSRLQKLGRTTYNGNTKLSSVRSAYVLQQDVLLPTLTVRETLRYSADLRLPPPTTAEERRSVVEEVILELGLKECANTRIGNEVHKGCSGGEKRRTSLGVQMLANPSVLFLDEVTTGLDATSAFQLVRTLKYLAGKGRTIVIIIHQPRSEIWGLFDNILLLAEGSTIYSGSASAALSHFAALGYELPPFVNPAEFLIDLAAIDTRSPELEEPSRTRVESLKQAWITTQEVRTIEVGDKGEPIAEIAKNEQSTRSHKQYASFGRQLKVQTDRTLKTTIRDPLGMSGSLVASIAMGLIAGLIFLQLSETQAGIRSREGAIYTAAALQGYLVLLFELYRLTQDIQVFDRERSEGVTGVFPWLFGRRLARMITEDVLVPLVFSVIYYFMVGFRHNPNQFFIFFAVVLLNQYISVCQAVVCIGVSRDFAVASLVANLSFTLQSICSGFFIQSTQIPVYVRWFKYTAYVWYANGALVTNEFIAHTPNPAGQLYDCPSPGGYTNPACIQYTGRFIVENLGFPSDWLWKPILVLVAYIVAFFFGSALLLKFWQTQLTISRAQNNDVDQSAGKERIQTRSTEEARSVRITLNDYSLKIQKRNVIGRKTREIKILQPVNATFEPGVLNCILGPSGSGKSSLLNMMAHRLHSSYTTRYQKGGTMLFGGSNPSDEVVRSVTSYVCQDDDALLPTLTVRETLYFAARLRLPTWMSKEEKNQRAESTLMKLGLRDCADNLVGDANKKGISGGEKRRVTIAIQVLTDPRVLLLDEPTSGLDAFTATSIMDVLRALAGEGKTIVLTIHQSRSDLFKHFGNILLLARGGYPVYAGKGSEMISHFAALGYQCPRTTNPADFALDLITVDLQSSIKEATSRDKVKSLIGGWKANGQVARTTSQISAPAELGSLKRQMTPLFIALPLLVRRSLISFRRNPDAINARIMQVFGFAIVLAVFWAPVKFNYEAVQSRLGFLQQWQGLYFVGMLQNVAVYPYERSVFYREHDDRAYPVEAFFLQYTILEIPFEIISSLLFAVLEVLAVGLPRTPSLFFIVAFNCFCIVNCGESLGIMFNTLFDHTGFAVNVTSVILSVAVLMAGVLSLNIPAFLQAFNHLSPLKWSIQNIVPYTLQGLTFTCTEAQKLPNGQCPISTGEQAIELYNVNSNPRLSLLALGICLIVYRFVSYLLLKFKRTPWNWKERLGRRSQPVATTS